MYYPFSDFSASPPVFDGIFCHRALTPENIFPNRYSKIPPKVILYTIKTITLRFTSVAYISNIWRNTEPSESFPKNMKTIFFFKILITSGDKVKKNLFSRIAYKSVHRNGKKRILNKSLKRIYPPCESGTFSVIWRLIVMTKPKNGIRKILHTHIIFLWLASQICILVESSVTSAILPSERLRKIKRKKPTIIPKYAWYNRLSGTSIMSKKSTKKLPKKTPSCQDIRAKNCTTSSILVVYFTRFASVCWSDNP